MNGEMDISPAEWRVMRVVWTLGQATSTQVTEALAQRADWKPATITTLLRRLVQKGALKTTQQGRAFIYTPLIPEQDSMDQAVDQLFDAMCQMRAGKTIIHLLERSVLSQKDIATMQAILTEKPRLRQNRCRVIAYRGWLIANARSQRLIRSGETGGR